MQLIEGFMAVLHPATLFLIIGGVVAGIVFGAIPGLSAFTALALFLPITFGMEPVNGIAFLIAIYVGGLVQLSREVTKLFLHVAEII